MIWTGRIASGVRQLDYGLRDLAIFPTGGTSVLYAATKGSGGITAYRLAEDRLAAPVFNTAFGPTWADSSETELSWLGGDRLGVLSDGRGLLGYQINSESGGLSAPGRMPLPALPAKITTLLSPEPGGTRRCRACCCWGRRGSCAG